jgi:hypothetical protein
MQDPAGAGRVPTALSHSSALAWLLDVRQRLNVSVDLVDDALTPLLPTSNRRARAARSSAFDLNDEQFHPTILGSMRSLKQEAVSLDGINVVSTPIVGTDGRAAGALLVSERLSPHGPVQGNPRELARIGTWLAGAIDAQFASALANNALEFQQLASLHRLLTRVAKQASERELVRAFIEAVAVWHDAESWGYVRDLTGCFRRSVSLPGSIDESAPRVIPDQDLGSDPVVRLTAEQALALGFEPGRDVMIARISGRAAAEWLIVARGPVEQQSEARLALYVDVLGRALATVAGVESSQLTWAMLLHLMQAEQTPEVAAARAIEEVSTSLKADASFALFSRETCIFSVGPSAPQLLTPTAESADWLVLPVKVTLPYRAAIGVRRGGDHPLTHADEKLLQSAGLTLAFWLNGVVDGMPGVVERRNPKSFEQLIDQQTAAALARGQHVSLVMISLGPHPAMASLAKAWISTIRALLRPGDLTGSLGTGDIGILLPATTAESARIVVERVRSVLVSDTGIAVNATFCLASRAPGSPSTESLLVDATPLSPRQLAGGNGH